MIFVFSGTGNSAYVARRLGTALGQEVRSINDALAGRGLSIHGIAPSEPLVFVAPTYAWRLPRIVRDWIARTDFGPGHEAYFVLTCGGDVGNAPAHLVLLCKRRGLDYRGCAQIVMPDNYLVMFDVPDEGECRRIVAAAGPAIDEVAARIGRGDDLVPPRPGLVGRLKSGPVNAMFYAVYIRSKLPSATEACVGCGACVKMCPLGNISLDGAGRPAWGARCTHCMACVSGCPHQAVECGKGTRGKRRYRCPV